MFFLRCVWPCVVSLALSPIQIGAVAFGNAEPRACQRTQASTIAFVGDLIFQGDLQSAALAPGSSYRRFWESVDQFLGAVDGVYGNLEGTLSHNITHRGDIVTGTAPPLFADVYSSSPESLNFNYHPRLATELRASGFRVISTANNHALDRGSIGVDQTIEQLERNGITPIGTRHSQLSTTAWERVTRIGGLNIGWVACTYGTNGHLDVADQVLECYSEREQVLAAIRSLAERTDVDAVFFVPHWGIEDLLVIARRQRALAQDAAAAGATAIVGTHPHILQEWEWLTEPSQGSALVVYSTGNFISAQQLPHRTHPAKARGSGLIRRLEPGLRAPPSSSTA